MRKLSRTLREWFTAHQSMGCDLYDLALGLYVEHDLTETYDSLQKLYKKYSWTLPPKRMDRHHIVERSPDGSIKISRDGSPVEDVEALWKSIKESLVPVFAYTSSTSFTGMANPVFYPVPEHEQQDLSGIVETTVARVLDRLGVKGFDRPVYKDNVEDIPDSAVIVILNDHHIPYHDPPAVAVTTEFVKEIKPDYIVLNGDIMDCKPLSRFERGRFGHFTLRQEAEQVRVYLESLRTISDAKIIYVPGNHEFRIDNFVRNNVPEFEDMDALSLPDLLKFEEYNISLWDTGFRESYIRFDDFYIGHWHKANKHAGFTAKNLLMDLSVDFVQAHVHRAAVHHKRFLNHEKVGIENGCLCQLDPHFQMHTDWQHAFSIVHKIGKTYYPHLIKITDGQFVYDGHLWKVGNGTLSCNDT